MAGSPSFPPTGGYFPFAELAQGGMGRTLIAARPETLPPSFVVIKRPHAHLLTDPSVHQRFHHEAAIASAVSHENLVRTLLSGEDPDGPYIVLEYVHGITLAELVDRSLLKGRPLGTRPLREIAVRAAQGLAALHTARDPKGRPLKAVHRDVSPQNILVSSEGRVKLGDFGTAKSDLSQASTDARSLLGKLAYLPPEYLTKKHLSPALDIYSLGISLFHAAMGRAPFSASSERALLRAVLTDPFPREALGARGLSPDLVEIVAQMCGKEANSRPTAREVEQALAHGDDGSRSLKERSLREEVQLLAGRDLEEKWEAFQKAARNMHG